MRTRRLLLPPAYLPRLAILLAVLALVLLNLNFDGRGLLLRRAADDVIVHNNALFDHPADRPPSLPTADDDDGDDDDDVPRRDWQPPRSDPDGNFNNLPVFYREVRHDGGFHSGAHCVGENFRDDAWKYRSCEFRNLCFDSTEGEFVLFASKEQRALEKAVSRLPTTSRHEVWPASGLRRTAVSVGGVHPRYGNRDVALKWYPRIGRAEDLVREGGYYALPSDYVMVPWNSYHGFNPGHIITDDFLPIYTLLSYFDLTVKKLALIHIDLPERPDDYYWDNCQNHREECDRYMKRFLPLLGTELEKTSTQRTAELRTTEKSPGEGLRSRYVCAARGVAGMGMLTDHGNKLHGNFQKDFLWTHNVGRGDTFYRFRNWMIGNLLGKNGNAERAAISERPYRIVISNNSSSDANRNVSFSAHAALLEKELGGKYDLDIKEVKLSDMTMAEQVKLASGTSILITMCGGGASIAHFLPRGASLIVYFNEFSPEKRNVTTGNYNGWVMDWDTYNNFGYIRTHWMPWRYSGNETSNNKAQETADMNVFVKLLDQELDLISYADDNH